MVQQLIIAFSTAASLQPMMCNLELPRTVQKRPSSCQGCRLFTAHDADLLCDVNICMHIGLSHVHIYVNIYCSSYKNDIQASLAMVVSNIHHTQEGKEGLDVPDLA